MNMHETLLERMKHGLLALRQEDGSYRDGSLVDIRPTAEIVHGLLRLHIEEGVEQSLRWLLSKQHYNGSWGEEMHHATIRENTLATAVIGETLLAAHRRFHDKRYADAARKSFTFLLSQEMQPGSFAKIPEHKEDILNVDAACASFFHAFYLIFKEQRAADARDRILRHLEKSQLEDGAYPYSVVEKDSPQQIPLRDPYYHALTLFFIMRTQQYPSLSVSIRRAFAWLDAQLYRGRFRWDNSDVLFSLGSTPAYAFSAACFHAAKLSSLPLTLSRLHVLQRRDGLFDPFEHVGSWQSLQGLYREITGQLPLAAKMQHIKERCKRIVKSRSSHPDLFYHSQIFYALSTLQGELL
ncbi:MAG: hypothetical protein AABX72_03330 [Nanoarchaeota archaeon]